MELLQERPAYLGRYEPGFSYVHGYEIPPPYPQFGEAIREEDNGSSTSVPSTPRQEDHEEEPETRPDDEEYSIANWYAHSEPVQRIEYGGFYTDNGVNMQGRYIRELTDMEAFTEEYNEHLRHSRRRGVNRREDELEL